MPITTNTNTNMCDYSIYDDSTKKYYPCPANATKNPLFISDQISLSKIPKDYRRSLEQELLGITAVNGYRKFNLCIEHKQSLSESLKNYGKLIMQGVNSSIAQDRIEPLTR